MVTTQQEIFKRILVKNKLMSEMGVESLLEATPDPEEAVRQLVGEGALPLKTAKQLLAVYRKKVKQAASGGGTTSATATRPEPAVPEETKPSITEALDELMDEGPPQEDAAPSSLKPQPSSLKPHPSSLKPHPSSLKPQAAEDKDDGEFGLAPPVEIKRPATEPAPLDEPETRSPAASPTVRVTREAADVTTGDRVMIHRILSAARDAGASDVHVKSGEVPVVRVVSRLREMDLPPIDPDVCEAGLLELLNDAQRESFHETNDFDFCYDGGAELGRFRTNLFRQHHGVDGIFRLIPNQVPRFADLNLPDQVKRLTDYSQGVVLITGPKSCGKTTTLAAMIDLINATRSEHIITIEDPIEFVHPCKKSHVNQREVGIHTKSFSKALRAGLREAPDVIMVGEMRDLETTAMAITAAETGHLVLATLHTPDASRTIGRVLDVFPPKEQGQIRSMLSESLRGIVSQKLLPAADGKSLVLGLEVLINTSAVGHLIREDRTFQLRGVMQTGKRLGMVLMDDSLIKLVKEGRIKQDEALQLAEDRKYMEEGLAGVK